MYFSFYNYQSASVLPSYIAREIYERHWDSSQCYHFFLRFTTFIIAVPPFYGGDHWVIGFHFERVSNISLRIITKSVHVLPFMHIITIKNSLNGIPLESFWILMLHHFGWVWWKNPFYSGRTFHSYRKQKIDNPNLKEILFLFDTSHYTSYPMFT